MPDGRDAEVPIVEVDAPTAAPPVDVTLQRGWRPWRPAVALVTILVVLICAAAVLRGQPAGQPPKPPVPTSGPTAPRQVLPTHHVAPPPGGYVLPRRDVYPLDRARLARGPLD